MKVRRVSFVIPWLLAGISQLVAGFDSRFDEQLDFTVFWLLLMLGAASVRAVFFGWSDK